MEITITFLYEKEIQQMASFSKELIELYNLTAATLYKLCAPKQFFQPRTF